VLTTRHLYPVKLALTSPTSGGRSVGIVRLLTKAMELLLFSYLGVKVMKLIINQHPRTLFLFTNDIKSYNPTP
jgi:hypothetical protein